MDDKRFDGEDAMRLDADGSPPQGEIIRCPAGVLIWGDNGPYSPTEEELAQRPPTKVWTADDELERLEKAVADKSAFPRCDTCRHWRHADGDGSHSHCWLLSKSEAQTRFRLAWRFIGMLVFKWQESHSGREASAYTAADFGCVLHEEKTDG